VKSEQANQERHFPPQLDFYQEQNLFKRKIP
jgi:hypothetical protein